MRVKKELREYPVLLGFPTSNQGKENLKVWCAYCLKWHYHGSEGHKVAHCHEKHSTYLDKGYVVKRIIEKDMNQLIENYKEHSKHKGDKVNE